MKSMTIVLSMLACLAAPARADTARVFGIGNSSCATWLSSKQFENEGSVWVMGAWSGLNIGGPKRDIGRSTDGRGLVAAVKAECRRDLSVNLSQAVSTVFATFLRAGR